MFVEYWSGTGNAPVWGSSDDPQAVVASDYDICSLTEASFVIGRDYALFDALAGVRGNADPLYLPRGLPPSISHAVGEHALLPIIEDNSCEPEFLNGVPRRHAARAVAEGSARYGGLRSRKPYQSITRGGRAGSWLFLREVDASLAHHGLTVGDCCVQFVAVIAGMRTLEGRLGRDRTRLVFWFF